MLTFFTSYRNKTSAKQLSIHINLLAEEDKQSALAFIRSLKNALNIAPLSVKVTSVEHSR